MRDALTTHAWGRRWSGGIAVTHNNAARIDGHDHRRDAPQYGVRATTLIGHARLHLNLAARQQLQDDRCCASADVPHAQRNATPEARRQWRPPVRLAFERVEDLLGSRAMDALAGDARLTVAQRVPPPQLDRIDAERLGNHVHVTLAGEHRLWVARRAHRTTGNAVGVDGSGLEPGHRHVVRGERVVRGNHQVGRDLAGGIRTTVDGHLRLMSQERAVVAHGRAECHDGRMPRVAGL